MVNLDNCNVVMSIYGTVLHIHEIPNSPTVEDKTLCGRPCSTWLRRKDRTVDDAIASPFTCQRCKKIITEAG